MFTQIDFIIIQGCEINMITTKNVTIKWIPNVRKYYEEKGYIYTKMRDSFEIKTSDLTNGSGVKVDVKCDGCGKERKDIRFSEYTNYIKKNGVYYCNKCANKLIAKAKVIKTWLDKGESFAQWCYNNLSKSDADQIILRWDHNLNNNLNPEDVTSKSSGINERGYWFKCLDHPEHGSEQKNIRNFTRGEQGSINCIKCTKIAITHPEIVKYFVNKGDALKYSIGTTELIFIKCETCGNEKLILPRSFVRCGLGCPKCSDGRYPEKFIFSLLDQLEVDFVVQLSKKTLSWCKKYKYDNYLKSENCIIETHGGQHYKEAKNWKMSLSEIQDNDKNKKQLAIQNSIANYVVLDCRKSELGWIKNSIMSSIIPQLLNFKKTDIDWLKCHEYGCSSLIKEACELWDSGIRSTIEIADEFKIHRQTIIRYLKQGAELGWCDYDPKKEQRKNGQKPQGHGNKQVICLTTGEIFESQADAGRKYNVDQGNICVCCKGKLKSCGKHPDTGEKLVWSYYETAS